MEKNGRGRVLNITYSLLIHTACEYHKEKVLDVFWFVAY